MIEPIGTAMHSISTSLGRMVYYTPDQSPWPENESKPKMVFFHGFGGGSSAYEWSKVYPAFASEYRVIAPDLIGWGRSEHPERDYQAEDYVTTITEFLKETCDEPAIVVASSLTGGMMVRVAVKNPELFRCLILITPSGLSDFGQDYRGSFFAQLISTPILDRLLYSTAVATPGGIRGFLENRQFARPERIYPEIVDAYLDSAKQPNAEYAALSFVRGDLCFDLALYMEQLQVPTAMLWGKQSQFTGPEIGKRLAQLNPGMIKQFLVIKDVGLTPQLELPGVTIGLFRQFLSILLA